MNDDYLLLGDTSLSKGVWDIVI